jgi:hypothetical protein
LLRADLARLYAGAPVVVAMHHCLDALTNRDEIIHTLGNANVVLILAGHYHKARVDRYRDRDFAVGVPEPFNDLALARTPRGGTHPVNVPAGYWRLRVSLRQ